MASNQLVSTTSHAPDHLHAGDPPTGTRPIPPRVGQRPMTQALIRAAMQAARLDARASARLTAEPASTSATESAAPDATVAGVDDSATVAPKEASGSTDVAGIEAATDTAPATDATTDAASAEAGARTDDADADPVDSVFLYEAPGAGASPDMDPAALMAIDVVVGNEDAQAIIALYGQAPIDTTSPLALALIARYGARRYEAITRYGMAMQHVKYLAERDSDKAFNDYKKGAGRDVLRALAREGDSTTEAVGTTRAVEGAPPGWQLTVVETQREVRVGSDGSELATFRAWAWTFDAARYYAWHVAQPGPDRRMLALLLGESPTTTQGWETHTGHPGGDGDPTAYSVYAVHHQLGMPMANGGLTYQLHGGNDVTRIRRSDGLVPFLTGTRLNEANADYILFDPVEGWVTPQQNLYHGRNFLERDFMPIMTVVVASGLGTGVGNLFGKGLMSGIVGGGVGSMLGYASMTVIQGGSFDWGDAFKAGLRGAVVAGVMRWVESIPVQTASGEMTTLGQLGLTVTNPATGAVTTAFDLGDRLISYLLTGTSSGVLEEVFGGAFRDGFVAASANRLASDLGQAMRLEIEQTPDLTAAERAMALRVVSTVEAMVRVALTQGDPAQAVAMAWLNSELGAWIASQQGEPGPPPFDDDGNLMPGIVDPALSEGEQREVIRIALIRNGVPPLDALWISMNVDLASGHYAGDRPTTGNSGQGPVA